LREIEAQLLEVKASEEWVDSYLGRRTNVVSGFRWKATALQVWAILTLFLGVVVGLSLLVLEVAVAFRWNVTGVRRWIVRRMADYGPALFLCASLIFLISFRPLAEIFERYRSTALTNTEAMGLFWQMYVLGNASPMTYFYEPYHQWLMGTMALVAMVVIMLVRGLARQKTIPTRT
jgi:hypothetical protein